MYELITCKQPLEDVSNPSLFICQQGRPHITPKVHSYNNRRHTTLFPVRVLIFTLYVIFLKENLIDL